MRKKHVSVFSLSLLSALSCQAYAVPANNYIVVAPHCLTKNLTVKYETLAKEKSLALIATTEQGIFQLIAAKKHQTKPCGGFIDVSSDWQEASQTKGFDTKIFLDSFATMPEQAPKHYEIKYEKQVNQILAQLNPTLMWTNLTTLSNFENRYARHENGKKAAEWIKAYVEKMAADYNRKDVTVYYVDTPGYLQPSVVAKVGDSNEPGVVIGGHMDTIALWNDDGQPETVNRQPGADDDGTGTVTVLETARVILADGMKFKKPLYFVWYAAEEEGLIGSKFVVQDFINKKIKVDAVAQFDMTGFRNNSTIWLLDDYVNKDLTTFVDNLIQKYVKQPVGHTKCGYACSDHASWTKGGFASTTPFEAEFGKENKSIHSSRDTMEKLSLDHMANFAKLSAAFAVELAEPIA